MCCVVLCSVVLCSVVSCRVVSTSWFTSGSLFQRHTRACLISRRGCSRRTCSTTAVASSVGALAVGGGAFAIGGSGTCRGGPVDQGLFLGLHSVSQGSEGEVGGGLGHSEVTLRHDRTLTTS